MSEAPRVSTIILNWNGLADTRGGLQSLRDASYAAQRVIVVDNGSQQDEARLLGEEFGDFIHLIRNQTNVGVAAGWNIGIRYALERGTDYVLLLNNDVFVDPGFLSELVAAGESRPDLAAACPKTYFRDRPDVIYSTGGRVNIWTATARQIGRGQVDRGQFERVGRLDEDSFPYWEETDWCFRARETGLKCCYVPAAKIWHKAARSISPRNDFYYLYRRNALLFVRKRGNALQLASALLMHFLVYGPAYFVRHPSRIGRAPAEARALLWHATNRRGSNQARQPPLV